MLGWSSPPAGTMVKIDFISSVVGNTYYPPTKMGLPVKSKFTFILFPNAPSGANCFRHRRVPKFELGSVPPLTLLSNKTFRSQCGSACKVEMSAFRFDADSNVREVFVPLLGSQATLPVSCKSENMVC